MKQQNKKIIEIEKALILGIKDYFRKNNFKKAVIGLSGGVDSSVAACLVVKALGSENVTGILMPEKGVTKYESYKDALKLAKKLKIKQHTVPINEAINFFYSINKTLIKNNMQKKFSQKASELDLERERARVARTQIPPRSQITKNFFFNSIANCKARIRMTILYYYANLTNSLVIGTSDKSEIALGYTTKYGDNGSDILAIGDLWKTQVIELGRFLKVPENILNKKPSAELIHGVDAEKELGAAYKILDSILVQYIEEGLSKNEIIKNFSGGKIFSLELVNKVINRIRLNENKRRTAMIIRVSERSFHNLEWRMPVTNRFES